jgi:hypothetical protein
MPEIRRPTVNDFPKPWEERPVSPQRWRKHRTQLMEWSAPGQRPVEWWCYEKGFDPAPSASEEPALLYELGELSVREFEQLLVWWTDDFEKAQRLEPEMQQAYYRWAGIPKAVIRRLTAEARKKMKSESESESSPAV